MIQEPSSTEDEQPSNESSFFRPEVMAARAGSTFGAIRLAQPMSGWLISGCALVIGAGIILFILYAGINKKARVTGITIPTSGIITVSAPNAGILKHVYVTEGQKVKAGQTLFEIMTERQVAQGEISALVNSQIKARLDALSTERRVRTNQDAEKRRALDARLANLSTEEAQLESEIALTLQRQNLAQQSVNKYKTLETSGFVSAAQAQQKQEDLIDVAARLSTLTRSKSQLRDTKLSLEAERTALTDDLNNAIAQFDQSEASLKQELTENQAKYTTFITSSESGVVTTLTNQPGQSVSGGQVLASLIPSNKVGASHGLEVHLYAPSRTVGFVTPGQRVLIRYQAFPYQKFGLYEGTVSDVSTAPLAPNELPGNIASTILGNAQQAGLEVGGNEALYRIKVKLAQQFINVYGQPRALKPGMTLEADVVQERRKIWEWVFEPLLAMGKRAN